MEPTEPILSHVLRVERVVFESPLVCAGLFRCAPADPLFPAGHPCSAYCIVFPREAAWIQHEGGRRFVADASMATIYNQGQTYRRWAIAGRPDRCDWLAFPASVVRQAVSRFSGADADSGSRPLRFGSAPIAASLYAGQRRLFAALEREAGSGTLDALAVEERAFSLLDAVLRSAYAAHAEARTGSRSTRTRDAVEFARLLMARDPSSRRSLSALAQAGGVSPYHLCREFRRRTGQTISSYRTQLRLRAALEPVAAGRDLAAVAMDLGFTSHSHFSYAFRRLFGIVPSALEGRAGLARELERRVRRGLSAGRSGR